MDNRKKKTTKRFSIRSPRNQISTLQGFPRTREFNVTNMANEVYHVMRIEDVRWTCTCPDHRFRQRECKHIRRVRL